MAEEKKYAKKDFAMVQGYGCLVRDAQYYAPKTQDGYGTIACTVPQFRYSKKDQNTGNYEEVSSFLTIYFRGRKATQKFAEYLKKGKGICYAGSPRVANTQKGDKWSTDLVISANELEFSGCTGRGMATTTMHGRIVKGPSEFEKNGRKENSMAFSIAVSDGYFKADGTESTSFIMCHIGGSRANSDKFRDMFEKGKEVCLTGVWNTFGEKQTDGTYIGKTSFDVNEIAFQAKKEADAQASTVLEQSQDVNENTLDIDSSELPF